MEIFLIGKTVKNTDWLNNELKLLKEHSLHSTARFGKERRVQNVSKTIEFITQISRRQK